MPKQSLVWHQSSVARLDERKCLAWKGRMPISDRVIFEEIAGDALAHFGYESETTATSFATKCRKLYYAVVARY